MPSTRKIIRAFLASPGDLAEERKAIRRVIEEFNDSWADALGYQVELIGWEEAVAGFGRPQHLINQDLERCDLLIGMIWKRWGTPPDLTGEFSSGFEEEFERSLVRREKSGSPDISLFFKQVPDEFMVDPGNDLRKVIAFRDRVIASKAVLFQNFTSVSELEALVRKCINKFVIRIRSQDESIGDAEPQAKSSASKDVSIISKGDSALLSAESFTFLDSFVSSMKQLSSLEDISTSDIARFRLVANSISKPGNSEMALGAHDINILYTAYVEGMELSQKEFRWLVRLGFQFIYDENVPIWCWYAAIENSKFDIAIVSSIFAVNEAEKVGAITVMTLLGIELPLGNNITDREAVLASWFSENSPTKVKIAGLEYLARHGNVGDIECVNSEYTRSDYGTSRKSLECVIEIMLRAGMLSDAQKFVLNSQFESLDKYLLNSVLQNFDQLDTSELFLGLEHRNALVRLESMRALCDRSKLDVSKVERLVVDSDAKVRSEAIILLTKLGRHLTDEDIKAIMIPVQKKTSAGLLGLANLAVPEPQGELLFEHYLLEKLKTKSRTELADKIKVSMMFDDAEYFALVEKYFKSECEQLRRDVDDQFGTYFEERIKRMEAAYGPGAAADELMKRVRQIEESIRKKLTRRGLDILCLAKKADDLKRIRNNLRDGYAGANSYDAIYLRKYGEWIDVPLIVKSERSYSNSSLLGNSNNSFQTEVAMTIISIGRSHRFSDLISLNLPDDILKNTIELCSESRFSSLSNETLLNLYNHESDGIRKAAALMTIKALPAKRIKSLLSNYVLSGKTKYYNVIHWLDLGASMRREDVHNVIKMVIGRQSK
jgi:hypothetical protein